MLSNTTFQPGAIHTSLIPTVSCAFDIGTAAKTFRDLHLCRDAYVGRNIVLGAASSKIIPGATSVLFRDTADAATNLSILDAGLVTVHRGNLAVTAGNLLFGAAAAKIIPGATSITFRDTADAADNLSITDAGLVTVSRGNLAITAGNLVFGAASAKIIPGATSLLFRDNADANTNLSITDAGLVTVARGNLTLTAGNLTFGAAAARIIPGATSLTFRDNGNANDNLIITDAGLVTIRGGVTISGGAFLPAVANSRTVGSSSFYFNQMYSGEYRVTDGTRTGVMSASGAGTIFLGATSNHSVTFLTNNTTAFIVDSSQILNFIAANLSTGAGTALLGTNCPAVTVSAPYTWVKFKHSDGSVIYIPAWK